MYNFWYCILVTCGPTGRPVFKFRIKLPRILNKFKTETTSAYFLIEAIDNQGRTVLDYWVDLVLWAANDLIMAR